MTTTEDHGGQRWTTTDAEQQVERALAKSNDCRCCLGVKGIGPSWYSSGIQQQGLTEAHTVSRHHTLEKASTALTSSSPTVRIEGVWGSNPHSSTQVRGQFRSSELAFLILWVTE